MPDESDYTTRDFSDKDPSGTIPSRNDSKIAKCEKCSVDTPHFFDSVWFCRKCGYENKELSKDLGSFDDSPDDPSSGHFTAGSSAIGAATIISSYGQDGKLIKINVDKLLASTKTMKDLMKTATTDFERQLLWNKDLFYSAMKLIGIDPWDADTALTGKDRELRALIRRLWSKTLIGKLARGRNALANIIACFIIAFRISHIRYDFEDFVSLFDNIFDEHAYRQNHAQVNDVHNYRSPIKEKVFFAERLILERLFGKEKCTWNKLDKKLAVVKDPSCSGYVHCFRMNNPSIPPKNMKEQISLFMSQLQNVEIEPGGSFEIEILNPNLVLENANKIFDDADKNGLISGLPPKSLAYALILLSLNKNSNVTAETMEKYVGISKNTLKTHADKINKGLKLEIEVKLF